MDLIMGRFLLVIGLDRVVRSSRGGVTGEGETSDFSFLEVDGDVSVAVCMGKG